MYVPWSLASCLIFRMMRGSGCSSARASSVWASVERDVLVRLSGWLYFNPDHPQDVGRTRATLWEISPVMQIEVFQDGRWNPLDKYGK